MKRLKISIKIAATFFVIGTILFLLGLSIGSEINGLFIVGFYYLIISIVINLFVLLALIVALIVDNERAETLMAISVILLNLPVAFFYAKTIIEF